MPLWRLVSRPLGFYQRHAASLVFRRPLVIDGPEALVSFTFDDFPRSALFAGGAILNRFHISGTYYASLGLVGQEGPTGRIFVPTELRELLRQGHELGCHTFSHCHSWDTPTPVFERSIMENRRALAELAPGAEFRSLAYPISLPRPRTKARVAEYFPCSRGGGQTFNTGTTDLNQLSAFFLEKSRDRFQNVADVIDRNAEARGWLILATHDVSADPTPFGCTPGFFGEVVRYAIGSGARILPVAEALEVLTSRAAALGRTGISE